MEPREEGYNQGFQRGWDIGFDEGLKKGHAKARQDWKDGMALVAEKERQFGELKNAWDKAHNPELQPKEATQDEAGTSEVQ